ncbi:hypothetical protein [Polaribacter sp.]|uniref:hypothetical protein n=1 Tax=Polaribacter sp. TaxID=1920175 RepID=UPI003F6A5922
MKKNKTLLNSNFYHKDGDRLIADRIPAIENDIKTFAQDLAEQSRPTKQDSSDLFLPKIQSFYQVLLELVFKGIGAFSVLNQTVNQITAIFEREQKALQKNLHNYNEKARVLRKDLKGLTDISHIIQKWKKWRLVLVALSIGEVAVNFKILLIVTPNQLTALVASLGLCTVLFIIAHSFKDLVNICKTKAQKWSIGVGIILGVLILLYSLNVIRVNYMENSGQLSGEVSEWSFVIINFSMWLAGAIIALLYKPLKSDVAKNVQFKKIKKELKEVESETEKINSRLTEIPKERDQKILDMQNLKYMAMHYQNTIVSHYNSGVALFKSENLFRRMDNVHPKSFSAPIPPLKTYIGQTAPAPQTKKTKSSIKRKK